MNPQILPIDFKARGSLIQVRRTDGTPVRGIYKYPNREGFYIRPQVDGREAPHKLKSTTISRAEIERGKLMAELAQYKIGLAKNPFAPADTITLRELAQLYLKAGCPGRSGSPRAGAHLKKETARAQNIITWPGSRNPAQDLTAERWRAYADWRKKHLKKPGRGGDRQIDIERATLSNIFRFALRNTRKTGITINPVLAYNFEAFRDPAAVVHCRDYMPRTGDELHNLARYCFNSGERTEVFGWLILFTARIGHRITAMLTLRTDAQDKDQPGYLHYRENKDTGEQTPTKIYLYRSHTHKGTYGHREIDKPFRALIEAHREWLERRYSGPRASVWYFPSPEDPSKPVGETALWHVLDRICPAMNLPRRTPHGLRAFSCNVLRSEAKPDHEIALLHGHKSQGKLMVNVYGEALDYKLTWTPETLPPAWETFHPGPRYTQPELPLL